MDTTHKRGKNRFLHDRRRINVTSGKIGQSRGKKGFIASIQKKEKDINIFTRNECKTRFILSLVSIQSEFFLTNRKKFHKLSLCKATINVWLVCVWHWIEHTFLWEGIDRRFCWRHHLTSLCKCEAKIIIELRRELLRH